MDTREWIEPVEAVRIFLRKTCPAIAESYAYRYEATPEQREVSAAAHTLLTQALHDGEVRARGVFNRVGALVDIKAVEFAPPRSMGPGYFNHWAQTLDCTIGDGPRRVYYSVIVNRKNVVALAKNMGPTTRMSHPGELLDMAKEHWRGPAPDHGRFEQEVRARGLRDKREAVRNAYEAARTIPKRRGRRPKINLPNQSAEK